MNKVPYGFQVVDLTGVSVPTSYESRITSAKVRSELEKALASKKNVILVLNGKTYMVSEKDVDITANVISIDLGLDVTNLGKLVNAVLTVDGDNKTYISQTEISTGGGGGGGGVVFETLDIGLTYDSTDEEWTATLTGDTKAKMDSAYFPTGERDSIVTIRASLNDGADGVYFFSDENYAVVHMASGTSKQLEYGLHQFSLYYNAETGLATVRVFSPPSPELGE